MFTSIKSPFVFQIFGASGHLAQSKIYPALYELFEQKRLPKEYVILGYARSPMSREEFSEFVVKSIGKDVDSAFLSHLQYFTGNYDQEEEYQACNALIDTWLPAHATRVCYFAIPPKAFSQVITTLAATKRSADEDIRLIMEKPFGEDMASANALYHTLSTLFTADQYYLLDHYLGKAAVQSILHLRHKNRILDVLLRSEYIANIQITAAEKEGIVNRAAYYEGMGAVKDMLQSHLLQLLALTTMAIPINKNAESIHRERTNMLESLYFSDNAADLVVGQYESYLSEANVAADSDTETFVAGRFFIDQEQWHNIPVYIRTGKKLGAKETRIVIEFKKFSFQTAEEQPNRMIFSIYPDESLRLTLENQYNSFNEQTLSTTASSSIACVGDDCLPEHGRLLLKVFAKDHSYFLSFPEILAGWKLTEHLLTHKGVLEKYTDGSDGPDAHLQLPRVDGFSWY